MVFVSIPFILILLGRFEGGHSGRDLGRVSTSDLLNLLALAVELEGGHGLNAGVGRTLLAAEKHNMSVSMNEKQAERNALRKERTDQRRPWRKRRRCALRSAC